MAVKRSGPKGRPKEFVAAQAMKCVTKTEFMKRFGGSYRRAIRMGWDDEVCSHMPKNCTKKYEKEDIVKVMSFFSDVETFKKENQYVYKLAHQMGLINENCSLTRKIRLDYTLDDFLKEVIKYKTKGEFREKNKAMYQACVKRPDFEQICSHMPKHVDQSGENNPFFKWSDEDLHKEALKYDYLRDFREGSHSAYTICVQRKILRRVCSHMKRPKTISLQESKIFDEVLTYFNDTKKYYLTKLNIPGKPFIKRFEADVFVPSLMKGIEYDGKRYHSYEYMRADKSKAKWSDEDIRNYHDIKDKAFLTLGIEILHITQDKWKNDKPACIVLIEQFLGITGFMSELEQKAA